MPKDIRSFFASPPKKAKTAGGLAPTEASSMASSSTAPSSAASSAVASNATTDAAIASSSTAPSSAASSAVAPNATTYAAIFGRSSSAPAATTPTKDPKKIITWNANGLMPRVKTDLHTIQVFVRLHDPDVLCLQEARLQAHCEKQNAKVGSSDPRNRSRPKRSEMEGPLQQALSSDPLSAYKVFWSLADGRSAGTALLVHKRLGSVKVACSLGAAMALMQGKAQSMTGPHHPEGRVQYATFASFDLLNTYVPNNGWTSDRHQNRRQWDEDLIDFLTQRQARTNRPLIWCGDLNVAHRPEDSTDEDMFRAEWDRDSKRFASKEAYEQATPPDERGIPGFTDQERRHKPHPVLVTSS